MNVETRRQPTLAERVVELVHLHPGITDRELTDALFGVRAHPSQINQTCRVLEDRAVLQRLRRPDDRIGNYPGDLPLRREISPKPMQVRSSTETLGEDALKELLSGWLRDKDWAVEVAWGKTRGADLIATRGHDRWIIEAKGCGSRQAMRVNYFVAMLGETLQRMDDPNARYSIAVPDMAQFRGLWRRLPEIAKRRTGITALFVTGEGAIEEVAS